MNQHRTPAPLDMEDKRHAGLAQRVLEAAPVVILLLDLDGSVQYVNPYFERLTGHGLGALRGEGWFDMLVPERDRACLRDLFGRVIAGANIGARVGRIVTRHGEEREIEWTSEVLRDEHGHSTAVLGIGHDVTDRLRAERAAQAAQRRQRSVLDGMFAFIAVVDLEGNILEVNLPALEAAGLRREDVLGRPFADQFWLAHSEEERQKFLGVHARATRGEVVRAQFRVRVGAELFAEFEAVFGPLLDSSGHIEAVIGSGVDITARVEAEEALREREAMLRAAQRVARIGSWALDLTTSQLAWSDEIFRIFELDQTEFGASYEAFLNAVHPEDRQMVNEAFVSSVVEHAPYEVMHRLLMGDGRVKFVQERAETFYDARGRPLRSLGTVQDITAEVLAEQALRTSEHRLRLALEASGQGTWELDLSHMRGTYSEEHARMLGYGPDELVECEGESREALMERVHPEDRALVAAALQGHLDGSGDQYEAEFRLPTKAGGWKWVRTNGRIVERDPTGRPQRMFGIHTDVDARKQSDLRVAAALREKETLLREVHHRVKNNLQIISSLLYFQERRARAPEHLAMFAELRERLMAMTMVHEQLYQSKDVALVELGEYVRSLVSALSSLVDGRTRGRVEVLSNVVQLPLELALPAGMIVCELVTNIFKHSFADGRFSDAAPGRATLSVRVDEAVVIIAADDDGVGFPAGFDPQSTGGFGWTLIRALVEQLGGQVEVESALVGAHVRVRFPMPIEPAAPGRLAYGGGPT